MNIEKYVMGEVATNTYILSIGNDCIIIDPASRSEKIIEILGERNLLAILLTHGHFDHIKGVDGLYKKYNVPVYLHKDDEALARDKNSGLMFGINSYITCPIEHVEEKKYEIGPFKFEVIYTPGHTPGSIIYKFDDFIITGDTLFKGSVGRTDLPGGNARILKDSLQIFKNLDKDYYILPGHEEESLLSFELKNNYFLR